MAATPTQGAGSPVPQPRYSLRANSITRRHPNRSASVFSRARQVVGPHQRVLVGPGTVSDFDE